MTTHPVFSDDMREIAESFVAETQEIFEELNDDLLRLEHSSDTLPIIDKIFRAVHTVKGTTGFLSLDQLNLLSHQFEDVLNRLRQRKVAFHPAMMDVMFAAFDMMTVLLQQLLDGHIEHLPMDGLLDDLAQLARDGAPEGGGDGAAYGFGSGGVGVTVYEGEHEGEASAAGDANLRGGVVASGGVRAGYRAVDPLADDGSERFSPAEEAASRTRGGDSVRVSVERLDDLLSLAGDLVVSRNRIARILSEVDVAPEAFGLLAELTEAAAQLDKTTNHIHAAVMQTRMEPVGRVFSRFQRVVRDLAKEAGKELELFVEGADIEVDRAIVDEVGDSILHLIRNAVDHGIEPPAVRRRNGKPALGRLSLRAEHESGCIVVSVEDDGAGIDVDALRRSAAEQGFASRDELAAMDNDDLIQLIFRPGLTTSHETTRISGRGVGMDVVRTSVTRLGGDVHVHSENGRGTCFRLKVPLTLSMMQGVVTECAGEIYVVPVRAVSEAVAANGLSTVRGRLILKLRDEVVPLIDLADTLDLQRPIRHGRYALVVRLGEERVGLIVDRVGNQEDMVIKPLTPYLSSLEAFAGSTVLGDGRVAMVLDVPAIAAMDSERRRPAARPNTASAKDEDSIDVMLSGSEPSAHPSPSLARVARTAS